MKILIPQNLNGINIMRQSGYGLINTRTGQQSFVRHLARNDYPRFHVYIEGQYINLHLDQKKASYEGYTAHSGEYDGEIVEQEGERIKNIINNLSRQNQNNNQPAENNKGFWHKFFGG
ncbi:MAG: hypothetical protein WC610_04070 [Patescibacteria group bacterium]